MPLSQISVSGSRKISGCLAEHGDSSDDSPGRPDQADYCNQYLHKQYTGLEIILSVHKQHPKNR